MEKALRWQSAIGLSLFLSAGLPAQAADGFSAALAQKLQTERPAVIDLATVAPFNWDELFVLGPGSTRETNCKLIQGSWLECRTTLPEAVPADRFLLVFRAKGRVVRAEPHPRANGDFSTTGLPQPVKRAAASFKVLPGASAANYRLEWKSPG
jgi:hypothetical protein